MSTDSRPSPRSNQHEHLEIGNWKPEIGDWGHHQRFLLGRADLTTATPNSNPGTMTTGPNPETRSLNAGTLPLLIEIGCEEIPARFLADAQKGFGERLQSALTQAGLSAGTVGEPPLQR